MPTQPKVDEEVKAGSPAADSGSPILVVDLGKKQRRKDIRNLRRGEGRLMEKVQDAVEEIKEKGDLKGHPTVVVVVREKTKSRFRFML
jgi:S1-C subfamily serine protease